MIKQASSQSESHNRIRKVMRVVFRVIVVLLLLAMSVAVYLAVYGVPEPILRKMERRAGGRGIPLELDSIHLSFQGWRVSNLRVYSSYPDDLDPILQANEIVFSRGRIPAGKKGWKRVVHVDAQGVNLSPSAKWCIGLEPESRLRYIDHVTASVGWSSQAIHILDGSFVWSGVVFDINGEILTPSTPLQEKSMEPSGYNPITIAQGFQKSLEEALSALQLSESATLDLDFKLDCNNPANSRCQLLIGTDAMSYRGISFSHVAVDLVYEQLMLHVKELSAQMDNEKIFMRGEYDIESERVEVWLRNAVSSKDLFQLLPREAHDFMVTEAFRLDAFPKVELHLGPARPMELLNHIKGSFELWDLNWRGVELASLSGSFARSGSRLDFSDVNGLIRSSPDRVLDFGSCMQGGSFCGRAFWDSAAGTIGIYSESEFDPNLLVMGPLSKSFWASNVISRLKYDKAPPHAWLELEASYSDWHSILVNARMTAGEMRLHDVPFSSMSGSASYHAGVLHLDSVVAQQGIDFMKGSCSLDFKNGIAAFDVAGSLNPSSIEDVVYPNYRIFGDAIKVSGPTKITAQGKVDWRSMRSTSFHANLDAQKVEFPFAVIDQCTAAIAGKGPMISVLDTTFNVYGGTGTGAFSIELDPSNERVPYTVDVTIHNADFKQCLTFLHPEERWAASGELSGTLKADSDFKAPFFETANGSGNIQIKRGQLTDLPLFKGFSLVMRKLIPSFRFFSINSLSGDYVLKKGVVYSENAYFDGDVLSAKGKGSYSSSVGFDAYIQAQIMSDNNFSKIFRIFTDPIFKLFELKLEGTLADPKWKLEPFSSSGSGKVSSE